MFVDGKNNDDLLNVSNGEVALVFSWVLYSVCSSHISPNRHRFDEYKRVNGDSVLMGNRVSCKTVGIGTMKVKMFDGTITTLTEVRNVSDLRINLI